MDACLEAHFFWTLGLFVYTLQHFYDNIFLSEKRFPIDLDREENNFDVKNFNNCIDRV